MRLESVSKQQKKKSQAIAATRAIEDLLLTAIYKINSFCTVSSIREVNSTSRHP
jgi:hypothetical protein